MSDERYRDNRRYDRCWNGRRNKHMCKTFTTDIAVTRHVWKEIALNFLIFAKYHENKMHQVVEYHCSQNKSHVIYGKQSAHPVPNSRCLWSVADITTSFTSQWLIVLEHIADICRAMPVRNCHRIVRRHGGL